MIVKLNQISWFKKYKNWLGWVFNWIESKIDSNNSIKIKV